MGAERPPERVQRPTAEEIQGRLEAAFAGAEVLVTDESHLHEGHAGARSGGHFSVVVITPEFAGKSALQRHRMVYAALGDALGAGIHALGIRAFTPEEFR